MPRRHSGKIAGQLCTGCLERMTLLCTLWVSMGERELGERGREHVRDFSNDQLCIIYRVFTGWWFGVLLVQCFLYGC